MKKQKTKSHIGQGFLLDRLQDSLSVFSSLQTNLLSDDISILSLNTSSSFRFSLYTKELILVPQLHLMLYCRCKNHDSPENI